MKYLYFIVAIWAVYFLNGCKKETPAIIENENIKVFGSDKNMWLNHCFKSADGNYFLSVVEELKQHTSMGRTVIYKVTPGGKVIWKTTYNDSTYYTVFPTRSSGLALPDGGIITTNVFDGKLLRLDKDGNVVYYKQHPFWGWAQRNCGFLLTRDNSIVAATTDKNEQEGSRAAENYLQKMDLEGNLIWRYINKDYELNIYGLLQNRDESYYISGVKYNVPKADEIYAFPVLLHINTSGQCIDTLMFKSFIADSLHTNCCFIKNGPGGTILYGTACKFNRKIPGRTEPMDYEPVYVYLIKIDENGRQLSYNKTLMPMNPFQFSGGRVFSPVSVNENLIAIADDYGGPVRIYKFDTAGKLIYTKSLTSRGEWSVNAVINEDNSPYITIAGSTNAFGTMQTKREVYFLRTNK